jgi:hypothetical protein
MSATIYEFPPRGRYATGVRREDMKPASLATFGTRTTHPVMSDAWYHDEAIDNERKPKN